MYNAPLRREMSKGTRQPLAIGSANRPDSDCETKLRKNKGKRAARRGGRGRAYRAIIARRVHVDPGSIRDSSSALAANRKRSNPALADAGAALHAGAGCATAARSEQPAMLQKVVDGPRWVSRTTGLQRLLFAETVRRKNEISVAQRHRPYRESRREREREDLSVETR